MTGFGSLNRLLPVQHAKPVSDPTAIISEDFWGSYGEQAEVSMRDIVYALERDVKLAFTTIYMAAYSVGYGFSLSADTSTPSGKKGLKLINEFCDIWELDILNQSIAQDAWASGNAFVNTPPTESEAIDGIFQIPLSSILGIKATAEGEIQYYTQRYGSQWATLMPDEVAHFRWMPIDGSRWGEGIAQIMLRSGFPYRTGLGKEVFRPSFVQMNSMLDDTSMKTYYAGLPRYVITPEAGANDIDGDYMSQQVQPLFSKLDPNQAIFLNKSMKVNSIALDTHNKFDTPVARLDEQANIATRSPLIQLTQAMNFSYASSETALKSMLPLIATFQRAYKRFLEKSIFEPVLMAANLDPAKVKIQISWNSFQKLTIDDLVKINSIFTGDKYANIFDPRDMIELAAEAGINLPHMSEAAGNNLTHSIRFLHSLKNSEGTPEFNRLLQAERARLHDRLEMHETKVKHKLPSAGMR